MSVEIKVPTVGESITEVTIANWLKNDGDYVEMDEVICELESEKASFELNAEAAGTLKIKTKEGDTIAIGDVICEIDTDTKKESKQPEDTTETTKKQTKSSEKTSKSGEVVEMTVPEVGESITEVTIASWMKNDGDFVELDEIIAEIDSDKATFELPSEGNGILKIVAKEGDTLQIGDMICKIEITEGAPVSEST